MKTTKNIPYYFATIGLFILLKLAYSHADNNDLIFLLKPTDKIVQILTGTHAIYIPDKGYYHNSLQIFIDKSCSGFNLMVICFCMLTFLFLKYPEKTIFKILTIPTAFLLSYLFTIFINASRIFVSIITTQQANYFLNNGPHLILHEIVGVITNLIFLIIIYITFDKWLTKKFYNEKFIES